MSKVNAYERGARAKRKGRLLEQNPFARRKQTRGNVQRANDWALGWHSAEAAREVPSDWKWPPLRAFPAPQAGDYGIRERGFLMMMRPKDLIEYDILQHEMYAGVVDYIPAWARIPYGILWHYASQQRDTSLGREPDYDALNQSHPLKYLWSVWRFCNGGAHWPPLVTSAYEELMDGSVLTLLRPEHHSEEVS
jgi:hypothetical protein